MSEPEESGGRASFEYNEIKVRGDIFEEFYYDFESSSILKSRPAGHTYTVGDEIRTKGDSYKYPDSFDIIALRDNAAVKIRNKIITEIIPIESYVYDGAPLVNGRGFAIKAASREEVARFLKEYAESGGSKRFFAEWVRFDTYRSVKLEYVI